MAVENNSSFKTLVFKVTYRVNQDEPQGIETFYTRKAAEDFALTVELLGGVYIISEDIEDGL